MSDTHYECTEAGGLRRENSKLKREIGELASGNLAVQHIAAKENTKLRQQLAAAQAECAAQKAEQQDWQLRWHAREGEVQRLDAEVAKLHEDAQRYRYIRDVMWHDHEHRVWEEPVQHLDAAIDIVL